MFKIGSANARKCRTKKTHRRQISIDLAFDSLFCKRVRLGANFVNHTRHGITNNKYRPVSFFLKSINDLDESSGTCGVSIAEKQESKTCTTVINR